MKRLAMALLLCGLPSAGFAQSDPLPSWNNTETKKSIVDFVTRVTAQGGPDFLPESDRIAVFDMDGTLIPEKPVPAALVPILADVRKAAEENAFAGDKPAVAALLKGDAEALRATGEQGINDIIAVATDGKTTEAVATNIKPLMDSTPNEKFDVPYSKAAYQPMRELLTLLESNGFQNWICSGSPVVFTRELSEEMFNIPRERVMGTYAETELDFRAGKSVLVYTGRLGHLNDQEGKPPTINLAIGKRPVFVAGNEGGRGDIAMMRWSKDRDGPSFQLLIDHDDTDREFSYSEPDNYSLRAAAHYGFTIVSMKNDWKTIVAPQAPTAATDPQTGTEGRASTK